MFGAGFWIFNALGRLFRVPNVMDGSFVTGCHGEVVGSYVNKDKAGCFAGGCKCGEVLAGETGICSVEV